MRLQSIQALRAVAAILVAYSHSIDTQMPFGVSHQQGFHHLQNFGAIGVDLFFVISGFIITYVARDDAGGARGRRFLVNRFIRINPIYWLASALHKAVALLAIAITVSPDLPFNPYTVGLLDSVIDTLLIVPVEGTTLAYSPILVVGWTLAFEWIFYGLFLLLILVRAPSKPAGLFVEILLLVGVGLVIPFHDQRLLYLTNPILLEFLLGVAICWIYLRTTHVPRWVGVACVAAGLAGYAWLIRFGFGDVSELIPVLTGRVSLQRVLWWGVPSALLAAGCVFLEREGSLRRLWRNRLLQDAGDASYSIYLVHLSVFGLCKLAYARWGMPLPPDLAVLAQLALAIVAGLAFYRWIEEPLLRRLRATVWGASSRAHASTAG